MSDTSHTKDSLTLSPKMSFVVGLIGGILVLCTIGFFILLSIFLKGGVSDKVVDTTTDTAVTAPADVPAPSLPEEEVGDVEPVSAADHVRGPSSAEVTMIEYSDIECPFCQRFHETMKELMADSAYKNKIRWVFRHYPLSFHANAAPAAIAAECAAEQGKFWEFIDELYDNQSELGDALYTRLAGELKLNKSKFDDCYENKKTQSKVDGDRSSGNAAGITGTPGTIIIAPDGGMQLVPGALPIEQVRAMVDSALQ